MQNMERKRARERGKETHLRKSRADIEPSAQNALRVKFWIRSRETTAKAESFVLKPMQIMLTSPCV